MKSLRNIIGKLSPHELVSFRLFLSGHCKTKMNKKLQLFDSLVNESSENIFSDFDDVSRQSIYQLKRRLTEELYAFLITQDQVKDCNDPLFLEMECHKKLYCFKILFDKGIRDHAHQVLNDVLNIASRHSLHSLYLEAVNLKNVCFPLKETKPVKQIPVNHEIIKLKGNLGQNLYVNKYLSEAGNFLHESDDCFRLGLISRLTDFDLAESDPLVVQLIEINHLLCQRNFPSACEKLLQVFNNNMSFSAGENILGLIYAELIKAFICNNDLSEAKRWLVRAGTALSKVNAFIPLMLELEFFVAVRSHDTSWMTRILGHSRDRLKTDDNPVLKAKWLFYELLVSFEMCEFKKVIKGANTNSISLFKHNNCLLNVKMLELLSILKLRDSDWLYYKIESFRKILARTKWRQHRISEIVYVLKTLVSRTGISQTAMHDKIASIEKAFPWHPLGNEVINYCSCIKAEVSFATESLVLETRN